MITREDIIKIAALAKLRVEENDTEALTRDMSEIISFADTISDAIDNGEDAEFAEFEDINGLCNAFHEDEVVQSFDREEILKNREGGENGCFVVMKRAGQEVGH